MAEVTRADPSESAAVLIGVSRYRTYLPDVPQAEVGVRLLAEQLASPEVWGLRRPTRLFELVNPDRAGMLQAVGDAARLVRPPGLLLIYFVGHAEIYDDHLCLVTADGDRSRPPSSMVTVANLVDEVDRFGPQDIRVVLILDCCYAGQAAGSIPVRAVRATEAAGWYFIGAADASTPADAGDGQETTPFTRACLEVLNGLPRAGATLRPVDLFNGLTRLLPDSPPVHNNAPAGESPWLVNRAHLRSTPPAVATPDLARRDQSRPHMAPSVLPGMVERPALMRRLRAAIAHSTGARPVVVTAVWGEGGFGKTVLVTQLCHDPVIETRFPGGVLWAALGPDIEPPDLADKINDLTELLTGVRPVLVEPKAAGSQLGKALDAYGKPVLLVVDDVWRDEHVQPFLIGGRLCRRVVTTRLSLRSLSSAAVVKVGLMTYDEAVALLTQGLAPLPAELINRLLRSTGRWPPMLGLANYMISRYWTSARSVADAARLVADWLERTGPAGLGDWHSGDVAGGRRLAAASIEASIQSLDASARDRYSELCIFPAETDIPYDVLALLWAESGGLDPSQTERLGETFIDASLAIPARTVPGLRIRDVVRTHLRDVSGPEHRVRTNLALVDAAARLLREEEPSATGRPRVRPWWTLPADHHYLWRHLLDHLTGAGLEEERDHLLVDLRWIVARVRREGPVRAEADLARSDHPDAPALAHAIRCNAHLLNPITPSTALDDTLASRLDGNPALQTHVDAFARTLHHRPRVTNHWPPPDRPDPALLRSIHTGHRYGVRRVYLSPDGTWLVTTGLAGDPVVRVWDPIAGHQRFRLETEHREGVGAVHISPTGAWLATVGAARDPVVQVWDPLTGKQRLRIETNHLHGVGELHVSPDGGWLATIDVTGYLADDGDATVRVWDPITGREWCRFETGHRRGVGGVYVSPTGAWLATTGFAGDPVVRIWDPRTGHQRCQLDTGHREEVGAVYVSPDGSWLATAGLAGDPVVRIWGSVTGRRRHAFDTGHPRGVGGVFIAPDGTWLATIGFAGDPVVRVWDLVTGGQRHELFTGHVQGVKSIYVSPDGAWFATVGLAGDPVVRVWDPATGQQRLRIDTGHARGVEDVTIAPDGAWLATAGTTGVLANGGDPVVRIWDALTGTQRSEFETGHPHGVESVRISPDGAWLVTTGATDPGSDQHTCDPVIRIWDPLVDDQPSREDSGHPHGVGGVFVPPDGGWLATVGFLGDPVVRIWDAVTGSRRHWLAAGHPHGVGGVFVPPDGGWLATVGFLGDPVVRIWDPVEGSQRHWLATGHPHGVGRVHVSPGGDWLATVGFPGDPVVQLWDPVAGEHRHRLDTAHPDGVGDLYVSPDGSWLATTGHLGRDRVVRIWDAATGKLRRELDTGHAMSIGNVTVSPDGTWLATTDGLHRDPIVRIWDVVTGARRYEIDTGHAKGVEGVYVSPDGSWLATTGYVGRESVVRIWDAATGRLRHEVDTGHARRVGDVFIAPNGSWLATTGIDGDPVVRVWNLAAGRRNYQLSIGQPEKVRGVHISDDSRIIVAHGSSLVVFGLVDSGELAAIRVDGEIRCSVLLDNGTVLVLGTSRGLCALRLIVA